MTEFLTQEGLDKLKKDLERLKTEGRQEIAEQLRVAIAFGDLSENAAYDAAKDAQARMEEEIVRIDDLIRHAKLISTEKTGKVEMGSTVLVEKDGEESKYQIVSPAETNPSKGKISYISPLGKAMLGKKEGEAFEFETPAKKFKCKVIKII